MRKRKLAFIDIEATGLDVINHEITQIGCVLAAPDLKIIEEFELKVKPEHVETADPTSLKISPYNEAEWADAIPLAEALRVLAGKTKDAVMVGQNVAFDSAFLEHAFSKMNMKNTMHYHKLDTISIAWARFHDVLDFEHFSLREMCSYFDIEIKNSHTGLGDARATYELYKKLMSL